MNPLDTFLLVIFPYVAVVVFLIGTFYRYRRKGFTVTSLSSQFLEGKALFWGTIPFHIGILALFVGHLVAWLLPDALLAWNARPVRLLVLEGMALVFGLATLIGLAALMVRRFSRSRIRAVTSKMDVGIELLLLVQIILGIWIALGYRWGSSWFASDLSPYLWSLVRLSPETAAVFAMPWVIKLHVIGGFAILFMIPFTRLVHMLVAPLNYIVRPYQQVIWNWNRRTIRDPATGWNASTSARESSR
jgi:nitrate reductase gamma subunit